MNVKCFLRNKVVSDLNFKEVVLQDVFLYGDGKRIAIYDVKRMSWFGVDKGKIKEDAIYDVLEIKR